MFYTGLDPRNMQPIYVPRDPHEKAMQRALIQYRKPENWKLVHEALERAGRRDLIGFDPKCLIRPYPPKQQGPGAAGKGGKKGAAGKKPQVRNGGGKEGGFNKGGSAKKNGSTGMGRPQNAAARNRAGQGRQGANSRRGHR